MVGNTCPLAVLMVLGIQGKSLVMVKAKVKTNHELLTAETVAFLSLKVWFWSWNNPLLSSQMMFVTQFQRTIGIREGSDVGSASVTVSIAQEKQQQQPVSTTSHLLPKPDILISTIPNTTKEQEKGNAFCKSSCRH